MNTETLIGGYAAYTSARELGTHTSVDARALAGASISVTIDGTFDFTC